MEAVATGQRVVLPPGTTLNFVLGATPLPNAAAPTSPPAPEQTRTSATGAQSNPGSSSQNQQAQFYYCGFYTSQGTHTDYLTGVFQSDADHSKINLAFLKYVNEKYPGALGPMCSACGTPAYCENLRAGLMARSGSGHPVVKVDWKYTPDLAKSSDVAIKFTSEGPEATFVELEHSGIERHGEGYEQLRAALDSTNAWERTLVEFQKATERGVRR